MKVEITGLDLEISDYHRDLVTQKLIKPLDKLVTSYNEDLKMGKVKLKERTRWGYEVKFHLQLAGNDLFAEASDEDLPDAVVAVREEIKTQVKKLMQKLERR